MFGASLLRRGGHLQDAAAARRQHLSCSAPASRSQLSCRCSILGSDCRSARQLQPASSRLLHLLPTMRR